MFFLIEFNNIESKEIIEFMFELAGYPNKTILSQCKQINVSILPAHKWIIWIDKDKLDRNYEEFIRFTKMSGIKSFIELNLQKSIYDKDWIYDNNILNNIFRDFI